MSNIYTVEGDNEDIYFVEASPIVTDESFDHEFGRVEKFVCTDVKIASVSKGIHKISLSQFVDDKHAHQDLFNQVREYYNARFSGE